MSPLLLAAALALASPPSTAAWDGVYAYTYDGGRTAGGSPILVTWRLTLKDGACLFHAEGFQTLETFDCTATPSAEGLDVRFLRYPPPAAGTRFGVQGYKPGAALFTLSRSNGRLLTRWTGFVPDEGATRTPAPFFEKVR
ncbi:DUF5991 domain-containing protein [Caulobacter sp. RL271]|jgi:hypothetical protein|uniref:DUF5991 domain-containing protein n=1 Tax=Caulobacter segnis TaxID=88688 RepID=A0ABY4ZVV6_9CAUL|nr:DUF5991 domain-containing protein [Caulobacter segnis]USQ96701.1 DUF5991 domain-containing protein [Caulobacter segnis]